VIVLVSVSTQKPREKSLGLFLEDMPKPIWFSVVTNPFIRRGGSFPKEA